MLNIERPIVSSLEQWKDFKRSTIWVDMMSEWKAREELLIATFKAGGDQKWTDAEIRARLSELDYMSSFPEAVIAYLEMEKENKSKSEEDEKQSEQEETE